MIAREATQQLMKEVPNSALATTYPLILLAGARIDHRGERAIELATIKPESGVSLRIEHADKAINHVKRWHFLECRLRLRKGACRKADVAREADVSG